jgi:hypothetical protein
MYIYVRDLKCSAEKLHYFLSLLLLALSIRVIAITTEEGSSFQRSVDEVNYVRPLWRSSGLDRTPWYRHLPNYIAETVFVLVHCADLVVVIARRRIALELWKLVYPVHRPGFKCTARKLHYFSSLFPFTISFWVIPITTHGRKECWLVNFSALSLSLSLVIAHRYISSPLSKADFFSITLNSVDFLPSSLNPHKIYWIVSYDMKTK